MADLTYVVENRLTVEADRKRQRTRRRVYGAVLVLAVLAGLVAVLLPVSLLVSVPMLLFLTTRGSRYESAEEAIVRAGARGEDATLGVLSQLPDDYTVLNQIVIPPVPPQKNPAEIDFIVIGPNGVFIVEVKNNRGRIHVSEDAPTWEVEKIGRRGTAYGTTIRNPLRQLGRQTYMLKNFLRQAKYNVWIEGLVYFSHPEVDLHVQGSRGATVLQGEGLSAHILGHTPRRPLARRSVTHLSRIIASLRTNSVSHAA